MNEPMRRVQVLFTGTANEMQSQKPDEIDPLYPTAVAYVLSSRLAYVSALQVQFEIGVPLASQLMSRMEEEGVVSPLKRKRRKILITLAEWLNRFPDR